LKDLGGLTIHSWFHCRDSNQLNADCENAKGTDEEEDERLWSKYICEEPSKSVIGYWREVNFGVYEDEHLMRECMVKLTFQDQQRLRSEMDRPHT